MKDRPGYSFDPGPPPEASRYLRNKGLRPSFAWQDVEPEEHAVAFTVAKGMQADVLTAIRGEVQRALDEGRTLAQFRRDLKPRLQELGWWGRRDMVDPDTGEARPVQLGSPRRLRTIYRSNLRSARAAGQWDRIQRTKESLPYLQYNLGPSERHRPEHRAKQGLVLLVDDPFWLSWYPPNGWGCKCWVRQITATEAERLGIGVGPVIETRPWQNPRTGEVVHVPVGIDPAWVGNPGAMRLARMEEMLTGKLRTVDPEVAAVVARDIATSWRAQRVLDGTAEGAVPVAMMPKALAHEVGIETPIVRMTSSYGEKFTQRGRGVTTETLGVLQDGFTKGRIAREQAGDRETLHVHYGDWRFVLKLLSEKDEVWVSTMHRAEPRHWNALTRRSGVTVLRD